MQYKVTVKSIFFVISFLSFVSIDGNVLPGVRPPYTYYHYHNQLSRRLRRQDRDPDGFPEVKPEWQPAWPNPRQVEDLKNAIVLTLLDRVSRSFQANLQDMVEEYVTSEASPDNGANFGHPEYVQEPLYGGPGGTDQGDYQVYPPDMMYPREPDIRKKPEIIYDEATDEEEDKKDDHNSCVYPRPNIFLTLVVSLISSVFFQANNKA